MNTFNDYKTYYNRLKEYPVINNEPDLENIKFLNSVIGVGLLISSHLLQRAKNIEEAININTKIKSEINIIFTV